MYSFTQRNSSSIALLVFRQFRLSLKCSQSRRLNNYKHLVVSVFAAVFPYPISNTTAHHGLKIARYDFFLERFLQVSSGRRLFSLALINVSSFTVPRKFRTFFARIKREKLQQIYSNFRSLLEIFFQFFKCTFQLQLFEKNLEFGAKI